MVLAVAVGWLVAIGISALGDACVWGVVVTGTTVGAVIERDVAVDVGGALAVGSPNSSIGCTIASGVMRVGGSGWTTARRRLRTGAKKRLIVENSTTRTITTINRRKPTSLEHDNVQPNILARG